MQTTLGTAIRHASLKIVKGEPGGSGGIAVTTQGGVAIVVGAPGRPMLGCHCLGNRGYLQQRMHG